MSWTKTKSPWRLNAPLQTWSWVSVQMCIWCKMQAQTQTQEYFASRLYLFCIPLHLGTKEKKMTAELVWLFSALFCDLTSCSILYFTFEKLRLLMHLKFLQLSCLKNSWENRKLIYTTWKINVTRALCCVVFITIAHALLCLDTMTHFTVC